jgi:outer membrane biosynthesis protein TonB
MARLLIDSGLAKIKLVGVKNDADLKEAYMSAIDALVDAGRDDEIPIKAAELYNTLVDELDSSEAEPSSPEKEVKAEPKEKKESKPEKVAKEPKKVPKAKKESKEKKEGYLFVPKKGGRTEKQFNLLTKAPIKMVELEKRTGETGYSLVKRMVKSGYKLTVSKDKEYFLSA